MLVGWSGNGEIFYAMLDMDSALDVTSGPRKLGNSAALAGNDYGSITADQEGHGILTWTDANSAYRWALYYALVDQAGSVITPPMIFYATQNTLAYVLTSYQGYGNTTYRIPGDIPEIFCGTWQTGHNAAATATASRWRSKGR